MHRVVRIVPQMLILQLTMTWRLVRTIVQRRRRRTGMAITSMQRACSRRMRTFTSMMRSTGEGFCCASPLAWLVTGNENHSDILLQCAMHSHETDQPFTYSGTVSPTVMQRVCRSVSFVRRLRGQAHTADLHQHVRRRVAVAQLLLPLGHSRRGRPQLRLTVLPGF